MLSITFINVGYGDAILLTLQTPRGPFNVLVDGGSDEDAEFISGTGRLRAADYLRSCGIKHLDLLVATHIHEDHICGLERVLQEVSVSRFRHCYPLPACVPDGFTPAHTDDIPTKFAAALRSYARIWRILEASGCQIETLHGVHTGLELAPGLTADVLGPSQPVYKRLCGALDDIYAGRASSGEIAALDAWINHASLMLRLHYAGRSILLPGDTVRAGMEPLLDCPGLLQADVLKLAHHGQGDSIDERLVGLIRPEWVITCVSSDRRYQSAHPDVYLTIIGAMASLKTDTQVRCLFSDTVSLPGVSDDTSPRKGVTLFVSQEGHISTQIK